MSDAAPNPPKPASTFTGRRLAVVALVSALGTAALAGLLVNVIEKKTEARNPFFRVVTLTEDTDDPAIWGRNFQIGRASCRERV